MHKFLVTVVYITEMAESFLTNNKIEAENQYNIWENKGFTVMSELDDESKKYKMIKLNK